MTSEPKKRSLVVIQLSGGNDYLHTVVPYGNGLYYDFRPNIHVDPEEVLPIDNNYGLNPSLRPIKELWDQGKVQLSTASVTTTRFAPISAPWTFGIPVSRTRSLLKGGSVLPFETWTRRQKTY